MIKVCKCRELNYYEHDAIINKIDNITLNNFVSKLNENKTVMLRSNKDFCIIHKSSKKPNCYQISYFDEFGAYADKEKDSFIEAVKTVYKTYNKIEGVL